MKQKGKDLLLQDLCGRLPYNVSVDYNGEIYDVLGVSHGRLILCKPFMSQTLKYRPLVEEVKPYLFPLSSMTEAQKRDLRNLFNCHVEITQYEIKFSDYHDNNMDNWNKMFNWCYKNHLDIHGLIPMRLAIDATELGIY